MGATMALVKTYPTSIQRAAASALYEFAGDGPREGRWYERRAETMRRASMYGLTLTDIASAAGVSINTAAGIIKKHQGFCPECGQSLHG